MKQNAETQRTRGIYLLPNLFTTGSLFAAFYSIVAAMNSRFVTAAVAIFIAMIADSLDGRIARLTKTQSEFGAQYDSLSDMVAFGLAPALVIYSWALAGLGKFGWLAAFMYAAAAGLRLARFNTQLDDSDKSFFLGLPSPSAAAIVVSFVWIGTEYSLHGFWVSVLAAIFTLLAGSLMVSNVRYNSFKEVDFKGKVPFVAVLMVVLLFVAISINPPTVLFLGFFIYVISGPLGMLRAALKAKRKLANDKK